MDKTTKKDLKSLRDCANKVFGDKKKAARWFKRQNIALGGKTPSEMAKTTEGVKQVRTVLGRIEYGVYS